MVNIRLTLTQLLAPVILVGLISCSPSQPNIRLAPQGGSNGASLLVLTDRPEQIRAQAQALNLMVEGQTVLRLSGPTEALTKLEVDRDSDSIAAWDESLVSQPKEELSPFRPDEKALYMAKEDFGVVEFIKEHPTFDGRGVRVGVIDDGISPFQSGFKKTSTGSRKLVARKSSASLLRFKLASVSGPDEHTEFLKSIGKTFSRAWTGAVDEGKLIQLMGSTSKNPGMDLNHDEKMTTIAIAVFQNADETPQVCVDVNTDQKAQATECMGTFENTGEYAFWDAKQTWALMTEFDSAIGELTLTEGEGADSHGEGVASVLAGHQIGGKFDGVAPGAQIVDYDMTDGATWNESTYTIGTFLEGLDWAGQKGAEVVNISYSLFFSSGQAQLFMQKALTKLIQKYNFVISFSAGNNGPGLGSLNRRVIYPSNVLVNGAYLSQKLDEYVHGNTGLPPEGGVIYYSSRGPGPDFGAGPLMISPLSSLVHSNPNSGFGAFSGTSSASPAMAGLATILISAVKQSGLPVDVTAVVHSLRLSAVPLPNVSFVDQGYGLPKIQKAFEIYPSLLKGEQFARINSALSSIAGPDGLTSGGLVLDLAQQTSDFEVAISLTGILSEIPNKGPKSELLKMLNLEYSHSALRGPSKLWVSQGTNTFQLAILAKDFSSLGLAPGGERTESIRLIDSDTGLVLHQIPVTILRRLPLTHRQSYTLKLRPLDVLRIHFSLPSDLAGYRVSTEGDPQGAQAYFQRFYDHSGTLLDSTSSAKIANELLIENKSRGTLQWALFRRTSTTASPELRMTIEPIRLQVTSSGVSSKTGAVTVNNASNFPVAARWTLAPAKTLIAEKFTQTDSFGDVSLTIPVSQLGEYSTEMTAEPLAQMSNLSMLSCMTQVLDEAGKIVSIQSTPSVKIEGSEAKQIRFTCRSFEQPGKDGPQQGWRARVFFKSLTPVPDSQKLHLVLQPGINVLPFGSLPSADLRLDLLMESVWGKGMINVGSCMTY